MEHGKIQSLARLRHTDLQPLETGYPSRYQDIIDSSIYRQSNSASSMTPVSAKTLASPSPPDVHQHYREHGLKSAFQSSLHPRNHRIHPASYLPRRHSILSPGGLTVRMKRIAFSSPGVPGTTIYSTKHRSVAEESREILLSGVNRGELAKLGNVVARRNSLPHSNKLPATIGEISFENTQNRLQEWGHGYMGNAATADIIVKAVPLRRATEGATSQSKEEETKEKTPSEQPEDRGNLLPMTSGRDIIVRARIVPGTRHRRPFLVQRRFNLDEMQASLPKINTDKGTITAAISEDPIECSTRAINAQPSLRRSRSLAVKQYYKPFEEATWETLPEQPLPASVFKSKSGQVMPIHIEYALQYLPVLAALMVSGYVRRGDAVDMPLPHPEAWRDVISYIYTGEGAVTSDMKNNILYLGGRVDQQTHEDSSSH